MAGVIELDDPADPRLSDFTTLTDPEARRSLEGGLGIFIGEGEQVVRRVLASRCRVRSVLVTPSRWERLRPDLEPGDLTVYVAGQEVLNGTVGFDLHRGAVVSAERLPEPRMEEVVAAAGCVAVLEGLTDAENLGALFRSAAALGVGGVLLDPSCADPWYRRTVRVSMGAVLAVPFVRVSPWPDVLGEVEDAGFELLALTPHTGAEPIDRAELAPGRRPAILLGAEGAGLRPETLDRAGRRVRIPMIAGSDSLNVGHAAAIAFHRFGVLDPRT